MTAQSGPKSLGGLEVLLRQAGAGTARPVESWNPPYCGDIGLAILADGSWTYQASPIRRQPLVKLFASVLRKDADGKTYLVTPVEKIDVIVADAPFLAVEMEVQGKGSCQDLIFRTNVDDVVRAGSDHPLRFAIEHTSGGIKPYVLIRGRLEALVARAVTYDLLALAVAAEGGNAGVWSGGIWWEVGNKPL